MNLILTTLQELIDRDLSKLNNEINIYNPEDAIWTLNGQIKNTAGNLCLHICGNLQHYIGAVLGHTNYHRNREAEFNSIGLSKQTLLNEIDKTRLAVHTTLKKLDHTILDQHYPEDVYGKPMTTGYFLIHLAGHLNYHLGQINYHRRLISSSSTSSK